MKRRRVTYSPVCVRCGVGISPPVKRHCTMYCEPCNKAAERERQTIAQQTRRAVKRGEIAPPHGQACADCGAPAVELDHTRPGDHLAVEPVCHGCNIRRGPVYGRAAA